MTNLKAIKRRLRELRADPGQPGARAEIQRLIGELRRAAQARDVADMTDPASRRSGPDEAVPTDRASGKDSRGLTPADREAIKTWPTSLRSRLWH
ncbi:hypothetical protein OG742_11405 [Streptomyces sp. NBC_00828]|uniref:hypothetical protein n=1 Tax=Streptomyces sp. NBC_00828 TaxID=2903678 RepID=UPI003869BBD8